MVTTRQSSLFLLLRGSFLRWLLLLLAYRYLQLFLTRLGLRSRSSRRRFGCCWRWSTQWLAAIRIKFHTALILPAVRGGEEDVHKISSIINYQDTEQATRAARGQW